MRCAQVSVSSNHLHEPSVVLVVEGNDGPRRQDGRWKVVGREAAEGLQCLFLVAGRDEGHCIEGHGELVHDVHQLQPLLLGREGPEAHVHAQLEAVSIKEALDKAN